MSDDVILTGKLLVASPALTDPNFNRAVIFLVRHDAHEGAFGVVLNRPIEEVSVLEQLPAWAGFAAEPGYVFRGGPVDPRVAFGLGRYPENASPRVESVLPGIAVVDLSEVPPGESALERVRIFSGYAGWSAGQLESELKESAWFVVDAQASDLFTREPETLWRDVLKRQQGGLAIFAHFPTTLNVN